MRVHDFLTHVYIILWFSGLFDPRETADETKTYIPEIIFFSYHNMLL